MQLLKVFYDFSDIFHQSSLTFCRLFMLITTEEYRKVVKKFSSDLILSTIGHTFPACRGIAKRTDDQQLIFWNERKDKPGDRIRGSSLTVIILPVFTYLTEAKIKTRQAFETLLFCLWWKTFFFRFIADFFLRC